MDSEAARLYREAEEIWAENEPVIGKDYDLDALLHAIELYRQAANQGNVLAMLRLGYRLGAYGLPCPEEGEPLRWLQKAADCGNSDAILGCCFEEMTHQQPRDDARSFKQMLRAAELGNAFYQYKVGETLYKRYPDNGDADDLSLAVFWLQKAAEAGECDAYYYLGECYLNGYGFPRDYEKAVECFQTAAGERTDITSKNGNGFLAEEAMLQLGHCYENGLFVPADRQRALKYYMAIIDGGDIEDESAQSALSRFSDRELGVDEMLLERAEAGDAEAQYRLGAEFDKKHLRFHAEKWYAAAAEQGHCDAEFSLAKLYISIDNPSYEDRDHALMLYRRSAAKGNANAQVALGASYAGIVDLCHTSCPENVQTDLKAAAEWFHQAAMQGHPHGKYYYGCMCLDGEGVEKNLDEGIRWMLEAGEEVNDDRIECWDASSLRSVIVKAFIPLYQSCTVGDAIKRQIFDWLYKAADVDGAYYLDYYACMGECLMNGYGTEKNVEKGMEYYLRAVTGSGGLICFELSDIERRLANCYEQGLVGDQSSAKAFYWYSMAAGHRDARSAEKVADYYEQGIFVSLDARKARIFRDYADALRKAERDNQMEITF